MEENKHCPSEINSLQVISTLKTIKKRKLQAEQLGLPIPKHKCWDPTATLDRPVSIFYGSKSADQRLTKGKTKVRVMDDGSDLESMKDSNSYTEDSDSPTSINGEAKPHSSLVSCGADCSEHTSSQLDGSNMEKANCGEEVGLQVLLNLEEQLLEFENHEDYIASEYGDDSLEQCTNKELEDILYANSLNPNVYVLSSGRWTVNQEAQSESRKPTIDQEFEQYFSMLML
ncbi:hypothetical protein TIFTF001_028639 [Ficus carica]|uniref:Uncharacterized protein n=1 Tax=Ficus carica TaxID=3494 RepID=A0AA88DQC1_FICCA|nr:hypothetical protein TIFTF001_028639 [Ficus carica]